MRFGDHYKEKPRTDIERRLSAYRSDHKVKVWNAFVDTDLAGINDDDFSIVPRLLPESYWPTLRERVYLITKFALSLLSLPEREIRAIVPNGPVRDYLIDELEVLRFRSGRITGSFRYDMAIVGPPTREHPPCLLEINEIGFDGLSRSTLFQNVLLELIPELRPRVRNLDTAAAEVRNMLRLGNRMARIQYDGYNWDEEILYKTAKRMGCELKLISPAQFGQKIDKDSPLARVLPLRINRGRVTFGDQWQPDAVNFSFAYELKDYKETPSMYRSLVRARTPQYGPFLTGLIAAKTILVLLDDPLLRRKLLGSSSRLASSVLPAHLLSSPDADALLHEPQDWVLKHADGCGGERVFMDEELERQLRRIPPKRRHEWILQRKVKLNLIDVNGILSRPKQAIADLGVFVQYDWANGRFLHFEVGGLMSRATNRSLKVNVCRGGLQVAVFLDRAH
jgi:hypothetical protein